MEYRDQLKSEMDARLNEVTEFIKEAFAVDGEVSTDGKQSITIHRDGSQSTGVSFFVTDRERGKFIVTLSNPNPIDEDEIEKNYKD